MPRDETVASFRKGLAVIRTFDGLKSQTITDVSARSGLTRAAARRFLLTLCEVGLAKTDGKHFELTPAILGFGQAFLSGMSELDIVRDVLFDLTRRMGESASGAMLDGSDIVYVARSPAPHRILSVGLGPGTRLPAHATSMGQALLAQLHPRELDRYLETAKLDGFTSKTLTSREKIRARLEKIRRCGYALVAEELEVGLRSIAVAIPAPSGKPHLAINMSAQATRVGDEEMKAVFLPALQDAGRTISVALNRG